MGLSWDHYARTIDRTLPNYQTANGRNIRDQRPATQATAGNVRIQSSKVQAVYRGKDRGKELTDMYEEAETKAIEKWLRMVDKPLLAAF